MGQILNRVINLTKSSRVSYNSDGIFFESEDAELRKIIDELDTPNSRQKNNNGKKEESSKNIMMIEKAFNILNIEKNANLEQIKKAYLDRIKEYHPDRLEGFGEDLKELAKIRTQEINQAYSFIQNVKK